MTDNPFDLDYTAPEPASFDFDEPEQAPRKTRGPVYHADVVQGSEAWLEMRRGIICASEVRLLLSPTLKVADNDKVRTHLWELLAQRISNYVEPSYIGDDMLRGKEEEFYARQVYAENFAAVTECGFVTNDEWGFTIGYSPDGLVGDDGLLECKSRRQKYQIQTIVEFHTDAIAPADFLLQCQTGLLVTKRKWIDLVSYSGGLPMCPIRIWPDAKIHEAIINAGTLFEQRLAEKLAAYHEALETRPDLIPTERRVEQEMHI